MKNFSLKLLLISLAILIVVGILMILAFQIMGGKEGNNNEIVSSFKDNPSCNVAVIPIQGLIVPSVDASATNTSAYTDATKVVQKIKDANDSINIQALLLEVSSEGGVGSAPDYILNALDNFPKRKVAQVYDYAYSGGYWVTVGAEKIFAQKTSDIGSIGVTQSYVENSKKLEESGEKYVDISTGEYKTLGDPNRKITEKEINFWKNKLQKMEDIFVSEIAKHRLISEDKVKELATGETWIASEAKDLGLIDEIGYTKEVNEYLQKILNLEKKEDLGFCY
jgi:protease-4